MADASSDGTGAGTIHRLRTLDLQMPADMEPTFELEDETHFQYDDANDRFVFDPAEREEDLETEIVLKAPDPYDRELGTLRILGDFCPENKRMGVDSRFFSLFFLRERREGEVDLGPPVRAPCGGSGTAAG